MSLILSKINVPRPPAAPARPRLLALLESSLGAGSATILNGRSGTGKSVLAEEFARKCGRRVAWYKVDGADREKADFFSYLAYTTGQQRPDFHKERFLQLVSEATLEDSHLLAEAFVYELLEAGGDPVLIVLEDLHSIYDSDWVVLFFSRLLPLLPADVHFLITGRSLPPTPLWRMRSKQILRVIDELELAFTPQEAIDLFQRYRLSEDHARVAFERCHGRAATMTKIALTWSDGGKVAAESFVLTNRRRSGFSLPDVGYGT